jgi:dTDP-4-amino-4,6-dideoxygalactose transaminase
MIIACRKNTIERYDEVLKGKITRPVIEKDLEYNYSYYPVLFNNESELLRVMNCLKNIGVQGRRYFYPSLNELPYLSYQKCPVSENISRRVLCLPLYYGLQTDEVKKITECLLQNI